MRISHLLPVFFIFFQCNSPKNTISQSQLKKDTVLSNCPDDGTCTFNVIKNKSIEIKKDEFGATYLNTYDSDKILLKFEYNRNALDNIEDSNYTEIVYIQINENSEKLEPINKNLSSEKNTVFFGRLCFCRGQTGYYHINQGELDLTKIENDLYQINLEFNTDEVPQVINKIAEVFKL
ncbi:hypothetical protein [Olleya sp. HaHaR_3_96]|uniref:hypothetical protein n=1 Tax=Olleya sp. HaHaR_3_96 TaxID=2745560 RepID=UPI001C4F3759|nr:hypothetical protein [Olleya sp. HaHaR_3_96]QXP60556.1 hypothetical protein H0I26_02615 [Olleya sp. HaHaR_3_96]